MRSLKTDICGAIETIKFETYESGGNKTAVDMILIKREHKKRIMNTKVILGEECVVNRE